MLPIYTHASLARLYALHSHRPPSRPGQTIFYSLAGMRFAIRYRGPFGALLALLVLDRHLGVVHAVWSFYGRHCCNVPLMFPVL